MSRLKTLSVLAGTIAALAVSAAPASAWWESNSQANEGKGVVNKSGEFIDETAGGSAVVTCPEKEIEATWSIQTKGEIKVHNKEEKQIKTKAGPHLHINVLKWGTMCKAKIGGTAAGQAHVSPCELQIVQPQKGTGSQTATAGVVTACRVEAANCTIIVPAGMETQQGSNEGINVGLKEVTLENSGTNNQVDKVAVKGIRAEKQLPSAGCPLTALGTASLTGMEITVEGAKLI